MLADNKLVEKGSYDRAALSIELNELVPLLEEAGLSIEMIGFEAAEIDALMGDLVDPEREPSDELPEVRKIAVSRRGDLWRLKDHRLLCHDAREPANFKTIFGRRRAAMAFADVPYNIRISSVQGRGKIKHREFAMASGELSAAEFVDSWSIAWRSQRSTRLMARSITSAWIGDISTRSPRPAKRFTAN